MRSKIPYIIIGILVLVILFSNKSHNPPSENTVEIKTDTLVGYRIDTLVDYKPKYISKKVVDTFYVEVKGDSIVYLPVEQKHYSQRDSYDCWVSGYNPQLDSIKVYNKTINRYITNTITEKIYPRKWDLYMQIGGYMIDRNVVPTLGLDLAMPNGLKIGGNIGLYDSKPIYGISVGYKLTK